MGWPQYTWIALVSIGWLAVLAKHGEPKKGNEDIGMTTASVAISVFLLWQGGFFG